MIDASTAPYAALLVLALLGDGAVISLGLVAKLITGLNRKELS